MPHPFWEENEFSDCEPSFQQGTESLKMSSSAAEGVEIPASPNSEACEAQQSKIG
jgi:hypothetical protein